MSQKITDELQALKSNLQRYYIKEDLEMSWDNQKVPINFVKDQIIRNIEEFEGFSGKGYFTLGKSFLVTGMAFWIGILLFLLQFKIQ